MIVVTGAGIVSAIGVGKEATLASLLANRSGIGPIKYLQTSHTEFPVGEVPLSNAEMEQLLGIEGDVPTTRTSLMGMLALREATSEAELSQGDIAKAAFISGTTVGGMDKSEQHYLDFLENDRYNVYISTHDCGACTEMIASSVGTFAQATTLSTACSSAANAIIVGAEKIKAGECQVAVAGGSECITKFHLNGFNTLRILDTEPCRPFDATRQGLNLGEGAAYLVLESEEHARKRGARILAVLEGYGNACDAYHQTASSPDGDGAFLAMQAALKMAGVAPSDIHYINAHGTGTPNNDPSEYNAMRRLFGEQVPPFSSTKSFTGHTTSASGSIEAVICLLAMQHHFLPANLNWKQPMENGVVPVLPHRQAEVTRVKRVLCNSFGFGGNDSSLLLATYEHPIASVPVLPRKQAYIVAAKQISTQQPLCESWMQDPVILDEGYHRAGDPDFTQFVPPLEARRMGKILKRAVATADAALLQAGMQQVDACITGTGLGCIENTELFLDALCRTGEELLKPTHFMQSTHNTISSLVSIKHRLHGYNATYAHKTLSFDSALDDALRQIHQGMIHTALVAGHDEMTPSYYQLLCKSGYLGQPGQASGETAVSLVLADNPMGALCRLDSVRLMYKPSDEQLHQTAMRMIADAGLDASQVAGVLCSNVSISRPSPLPHVPLLHYTHLFGESYTASALGAYVAATCLSQGTIPPHLYLDPSQATGQPPQAILLLNNTDHSDVSLTLMTRKL